MHRHRGTVVSSTMRRAAGAITALMLAAVAGLVVTAPANAAVPDPLFIQNEWTRHCLDHHHAPGPTTTVFSYPCQYQSNPPGNQQWGFFHVPDTNYYRVVNHKSGWCLSEPNHDITRIYAEICAPSVPAKQRWRPELSSRGFNVLINAYTGRCMRETVPAPGQGHGELEGTDCTTALQIPGWQGQWFWQPRPR